MSKPSEMPPRLKAVNQATSKLSSVKDQTNRWFADEFGGQISDVKSIMAEFKEYDPTTAAILTLATAMLTPEEY